MKPRSAKNKGKRLQNHIRDLILKYNELHEDDVKSTTMGEAGEDIQLSPLARSVFPYTIECKSRAAFAVYSVYEQASTHKDSKYEPVAFIKANRKKPLALIDAEHLIKLIAMCNEISKNNR